MSGTLAIIRKIRRQQGAMNLTALMPDHNSVIYIQLQVSAYYT